MTAGMLIGSCPSVKLLSTPTPTASFIMNVRLNYYGPPAQLGTVSNPVGTTSGSAICNLYGTYLGQTMQPGDLIYIDGSPDVNGILAANINGWRRVTGCTDFGTLQFMAGAAATSTSVGGGTGITVQAPASYIGSSAYRPMALDSTVRDAWIHTGGTLQEQVPDGACFVRLEVATAPAMTGELRIDDTHVVKYSS